MTVVCEPQTTLGPNSHKTFFLSFFLRGGGEGGAKNKVKWDFYLIEAL